MAINAISYKPQVTVDVPAKSNIRKAREKKYAVTKDPPTQAVCSTTSSEWKIGNEALAGEEMDVEESDEESKESEKRKEAKLAELNSFLYQKPAMADEVEKDGVEEMASSTQKARRAMAKATSESAGPTHRSTSSSTMYVRSFFSC